MNCVLTARAFVHGKKASKGSTYILNQVDAKMTSHVSDDKHVLTGNCCITVPNSVRVRREYNICSDIPRHFDVQSATNLLPQNTFAHLWHMGHS